METFKSMSLIENKKIAIVGGGPGGLTLARLLQIKGADVKVFERDFSEASRVQGAIVDLHYNSGLKAIEEAGLLDAFNDAYMPGADKYRLVDPDANILLNDGNNSGAVSFGNEGFRPEIDRGALRDILLEALLPETVIWDSQLVGMEQVHNYWKLQFKNGSSATADIVIGADGYRSKIRSYLTNIEPLYSGATIIQGEIDNPETHCPEIYQLVDNANLMAMGSGKTISIQPRGDGGLTFYAASMYPENWILTSGIDFSSPEEVYAYLVEFYHGWNPVFLSLFKACSHFVARPLNYLPLKQRWDTRGNITLLGDAAHLMPPNGEGVNLAMLDALDLSERLTNTEFPDLQAAMVSYENTMVMRAANLLEETLDEIEDFASPSIESVQKLIEMLSRRES
jgi:2-polyprenyl-6-methoxyphenol hydroxylase-like FAD-dependent oxidoreductase